MPESTAVHQVVSVLQAEDAVGNEVLMLRDALRSRGSESEIYVANRSRRETEPAQDLESLLAGDAPAVVIYHVATASRATPALVESSLPLVVVYHNVTPPHWFWGIDRSHYDACEAAHADLLALSTRAALALAHSSFSRRELGSLGFRRTGVFPLLVADDAAIDAPTGGGTAGAPVVLCVGRIAPNKCVEDVIRIHHVLRRLLPDAQLWIVGDGTGVPEYSAALQRLVARLGDADSVRFLGAVSRAELLRCYREATVLVSMSEHEGFGGTLVEAMRAGTPLVAYHAGAVPETMGDAGVLLRDKTPEVAAEVVAAVLGDESLRERLAARGRRRAAELVSSSSVATMIRLLHEAGLATDVSP